MNTTKIRFLYWEIWKNKKRVIKIERQKQDLKVRRDKIKIFIENLKNNDKLIDEFDERLWYALVNKIVVNTEDGIKLILKNSLN